MLSSSIVVRGVAYLGIVQYFDTIIVVFHASCRSSSIGRIYLAKGVKLSDTSDADLQSMLILLVLHARCTLPRKDDLPHPQHHFALAEHGHASRS